MKCVMNFRQTVFQGKANLVPSNTRRLRIRRKADMQNVGYVGLNSSDKLDTECIKM